MHLLLGQRQLSRRQYKGRFGAITTNQATVQRSLLQTSHVYNNRRTANCLRSTPRRSKCKSNEQGITLSSTCFHIELTSAQFVRRPSSWMLCGDGRLTALLLGDCWECACSSLRFAWWGVLFSEDRWSQRVDLAGSRWSLRRLAPVGVAACRTCRLNTRSALLELYVLTGLRYLADWSVFYVYFCWCVKADQI
jgi:hypothetical protein